MIELLLGLILLTIMMQLENIRISLRKIEKSKTAAPAAGAQQRAGEDGE